MYILRVENEKGYGPYQGPNTVGYMFQNHNNPSTHPTTDNDYCLKESTIVSITPHGIRRHGFRSKASYNRWFSEKEKQILRDNNYRLVLYKIVRDCVSIYEKQVVFVSTNATRLKTLAI
jgi:hypothetical protein